MDRRKFLKGSALLSGLLTLSPSDLWSFGKNTELHQKRKAKNIIFMVSDGMSLGNTFNGRLVFTEHFRKRK